VDDLQVLHTRKRPDGGEIVNRTKRSGGVEKGVKMNKKNPSDGRTNDRTRDPLKQGAPKKWH